MADRDGKDADVADVDQSFSATLDTPVVYQSMSAEQDDPVLTTRCPE